MATPRDSLLFAPGTETLDAVGLRTIYSVPSTPPGEVVRRTSAEWPGTWYRSVLAVVWAHGHASSTWVARATTDPVTGEVTEQLPPLQEARATTARLCGLPLSDLGWTYPSLARTITSWLALRQHITPQDAEMLLPHSPHTPRRVWHYQKVKPCWSNGFRLYDLRSAYWQMASRLPSPLLRLHWEEQHQEVFPDFLAPDAAAERRWTETVAAMEPHKKLRLALIGVNAAGAPPTVAGAGFPGPIHAYRNGEALRLANKPGPLQPIALLCVRLTYEVTQVQAQISQALYANADCVVPRPGRSPWGPQYWDALGLVYREKAHGPGELRGVGAYKIGEQQTVPWAELAGRDKWRPAFPYLIPRRQMMHEHVLGKVQ